MPLSSFQSHERICAATAFAAGAAAGAGLFLLLQQRCSRPSARYVQRPHPQWVPPQPQDPPFNPDDMHTIDPASIPKAELYPLVISAVVPRPIGG
jgi:hypothetical protein